MQSTYRMLLTGPVALIDNDEADLVHGQVFAPAVQEVQQNLGGGDDHVVLPELLRPLQEWRRSELQENNHLSDVVASLRLLRESSRFLR